MNVNELQSLGLAAKLENGKLRVFGLQELQPDIAANIRQAIAENRDALVAELAAAPGAALCVRWVADPGAVEDIPDAARLIELPAPPERFKNLWDELLIFSDYTQAYLVRGGDRLGLAAPWACDAASHELCAQWLRDCEADARAYINAVPAGTERT